MASFLFDLDGTLTLNRGIVDPAFGKWFHSFQQTHTTYLITGSEYGSAAYQLGTDILKNFKLVFTCMGNEIYESGKLIKRNNWAMPAPLQEELTKLVEQSRCPTKTGRHIEQRTGVVSFSTVGRNALAEERAEYIKYDKASGERDSMQARLEATFPDYDVTIAGDLGIDIYPKGRGKDQVLAWITDRPIVFFGDRTRPGGNDFPLATVADLTHQVDDWQHTWELLRLVSP